MSKRWPLLVWLAGLLVCAAAMLGARYSTDMSVFLPAHPSEEQQLLVDQIKDGALSRVLLLGIEGGSAAARAEASQALAGWMRDSAAFTAVVNGHAAGFERDRELLLRYRYLLSPAVTPGRFEAGGLREAVAASIAQLGSSAGLALKALFARDPTGEMLQLLDALSSQSSPAAGDGVWVSPNGERALLMAMTRASGADTDAQERLLAEVRERFAQVNASGGLRLRMSGTPVFSVHARETIKSEVTRLSVLGTLGVVTLLLLVYRSLLTLLVGLLPVASGVAAGVAAVALGFPAVHALTIGFGTTLIGEAIDYSIYYFVQGSDAVAWQRDFWPTVRLGVATSVCGFAVLMLSSFPGLAQLGAYSVAGLLAAAWVTRHVLPLLPARPPELGRLERIGDVAARALHGLARLRWVAVLMTLGAVAVVALWPGPRWATGLSGLNPAPLDLQALDTELRRDLGAPDLRHIVAVTASTREQALEAAGQVYAALAPALRQAGQGDLFSPTLFLPSQAVQRARQVALPDETALRERLALALADQPVKPERLAPFVQDVADSRALAPLAEEDLRGSSLGFAVQTLVLPRERGFAVLMPLRSSTEAAPSALVNAWLARIRLAGDARALFLDLEEQTQRIFGAYLTEALMLVGAGVLAVTLLLALQLRSAQAVAGVLAPVAAAVAGVVAGHALAGVPLTLLPLIGLLLIVAVGSNYALFFDRGVDARTGAGRVALASLVLANLSTLMGFGLLGFSQVPVLRAVGATVGPGALLALVLGALWTARKRA